MERPTPEQIREWSPRADWAGLGYPAGGSPDALTLEVALAEEYVEWATGRLLDSSMPQGMENMARKAVVLRVQQQVSIDDPDAIENVTSGATLKGFSVTGYAEQYIDPGTAQEAQNKALMINPWPELNRLLWALVTPERMAWWRAFLAGGLVPAYGVVEVDWSGANRWGGIAGVMEGGLPGDMPGFGNLDGWPDVGMWPTGSNTGTILP